MYETTYGAKYEETKDLSVVEVTARIRADIKAAQKAGTLPRDLKLSIRTRHHNCIDVTVVACPSITNWLNAKRLLHDVTNGREGYGGGSWMSDAAAELVGALKKIHAAYNYDGSDIQSDYFNVRYYGGVDIAHALTTAERQAFEAARQVARAAPEHDAHGEGMLALIGGRS